MKKILCIILCGMMLLNIVGCSKEQEKTEYEILVDNALKGKYKVLMTIKDYGNITLELDASLAPITVTNFINLVENKFYDGLTFHRIIDGFMAQGGSPDGTGGGSLTNKIIGEFALNGIENSLSHKRGVISMTRSNNYNSASCQFFIVHKDSEYLDGSYAAFGYVIDGIEVLDNIVKDAKPIDNNGSIAKEEQPIIESIIVIK